MGQSSVRSCASRVAAKAAGVGNGERVLLNCPTDEEVERRTREVKTLQDLLELPFQPPGGPRRLPPSAPVPEGKP